MTPDKNEMEKRRKQRAAARHRREIARRKMILRLILAGVVLILSGLLIWWVSSAGRSDPAPVPVPPGTPQVSTNPPPVPETTQRPREGETIIHIAAAGDLTVTDKTVASGKEVGGYDYSQVFLDVAPKLSNADLAIVNFEGNLCGEPYGTANASAPQALMQALTDAGVDMVQMANSYAIQNGVQGLAETLNNIRLAGLEPLGAYASNAEAKSAKGYTIVNVDGIKIGIAAFTKGMNNLGLPDGSEKCINLLYKDYATTYRDVNTSGITKVLDDLAEEKPDFTIALVHWGSEYNEEISSTQNDIRDIMLNHGVNAIIGTHPHLVQTVQYDATAGTLVAYSLGDFFGDAEVPGSNYSIILDLEITRDNVTGATRLTGWSYTPIYTVLPEESGLKTPRVVRIVDAMSKYNLNYMDAISDELFGDMEYVNQRIIDRTSGEG